MTTNQASNRQKPDENKQVITHLALLSQGYICSQVPSGLFEKYIGYPCYNSAIFYAIRCFYFDFFNLYSLTNFNMLRPL